jgi:aspartate racemase
MEGGFYRDCLEAGYGLEILVPGEPDRTLVHQVIFDELVRGVIDQDSRRRYLAVIDRLADDGADGIVLGCTEIELLVRQSDTPIPVYPSTRLHAIAAVDAALQE